MQKTQELDCYLNLPFNQAKSYGENSQYIKFSRPYNDSSTSRLISIQDNSILISAPETEISESEETNGYEILIKETRKKKTIRRTIKFEKIMWASLSLIRKIRQKEAIYTIERRKPAFREVERAERFGPKFVEGEDLGLVIVPEYEASESELEELKYKKYIAENWWRERYRINERRRMLRDGFKEKFSLTCEFCGKRFENLKVFIADFRECLKKAGGGQSCPICKKKFFSNGALDQHFEMFHFVNS